MPTIQVQCVEHDLMITNLPLLASGSVGVDAVQFSFCPMWEGFAKTAVFKVENEHSKFVLIDDSGKCLIPSEILQSDKDFEFGAFGIREGKTISTEMLKYRTKRGSYSSNSIPEPSSTIYQQIVEKLVEIESDLTDVARATEDLESYLSSIANGENWGDIKNALITKSLIDGSVTEIESQEPVSFIREYAFAYCKKLKCAKFAEVGYISMYAFVQCVALEKVDINSDRAGSFDVGTFSSSGLHTLIIRTENSMWYLNYDSTFSGTPIANGTGYIYVPKALVEQYKVANNWSTYANQFRAIEDYPDICGGT